MPTDTQETPETPETLQSINKEKKGKIADVKEEALKTILERLQAIDESPTTRSQFASGVLYTLSYTGDKSIFQYEIETIQQALGIDTKEIVDLKKELEEHLANGGLGACRIFDDL